MFFYTGDNITLDICVREANSEILVDSICDAIKHRPKFDMSTIDNESLAEDLREFFNKNIMFVVVYKPLWRWSRALGYYTHKKPTTIHLNHYRLNRNISSLVGTFYHEMVHMMDHFDVYNSYGHGDNSKHGKENTAPYAIGNMAKAMVNNTNIDYNDQRVGQIKLKNSIWFRVKRLFSKLF